MLLLPFVVLILVPSLGLGETNAIGSGTKLHAPGQADEPVEAQDAFSSSVQTTGQEEDVQDGYEDDLSSCLPTGLVAILKSLQAQLGDLKNTTREQAAYIQELEQVAPKQLQQTLQEDKQQVAGVQQSSTEQLAAMQQEQTKQVVNLKGKLEKVSANQEQQKQQVDRIFRQLKNVTDSLQEQARLGPKGKPQEEEGREKCDLYQAMAATLKNANLTWTGNYGGSSGASFSDCNNGTTDAGPISAIRVTHGLYIDSIQITYGCQTAENHGGYYAPRNETFPLEEGEHITSVSGTYGEFVDSIAFTTDRRRRLGPFGGKGPNSFDVQAPDGHMLRCIAGKTGSYMDSISFAWIPIMEAFK